MGHQYINIDKAENTVNIKISLTAVIGKEKSGIYVSYCPALDLYSQGDTAKESEENIAEATQLFIESCIEDHTLEKVLEDCGFSLVDSTQPKRKGAKRTETPPDFPVDRQITIPAEIPMMAYG